MPRFAYPSLVTVLVLAGCVHALPKTADLRQVHDAYRNEFAELSLADPIGPDDAPPSSVIGGLSAQIETSRENPPTFDKTLRAIREFRVKYNGQENLLKKELAHLQVLEGMIYLQSAHFGSAAAILPQVTAAGGLLTSDSEVVVRDRLFALAFPHLIAGWDQINRDRTGKKAEQTALARATEGIATLLEENVPENNKAPEVDDGGLYLAATAAIYWVWLHELDSRDCKFSRAPCNETAGDEAARTRAKAIKANLDKKGYYRKACALLGRYLSRSEKRAASVSPAEFPPGSGGRLRFLRWYAWFDDQKACS